jgi:DNA-binding protein HU-beta
MNKNGVISSIAKKADISQKEAEKALDTTIQIIGEALTKDRKITLMGFGNFSIHQRKSRMGRNPQTGDKVEIKSKKIPKFHAGKLFVEKLNEKN